MSRVRKLSTVELPSTLIARTAAGHARPLDEDIRATAARACNFAAPFGVADEARLAALWSDLGKARPPFQRNVRVPSASERVNHSFVGAWHAYRWLASEIRESIALMIAGTHAGLPDLSELPGICAEGAAHSDCLRAIAPDILAQRVAPRSFFSTAHREIFTRLGHSAHVDADRAEAKAWEDHQLGKPPPTAHVDLARVLERLLHRPTQSDGQHDELGRLRVALWHACKQAAAEPPGWYQLSAPSSIIDAPGLVHYAVEHAVRHGLRRVVLIYPTQAALDQRVEALREILGTALGVPTALDRRDRGIVVTIEDWDTPVVATTMRDAIGLLFDNRPASARRLHRLACAMILVEDAHRLPAPIAPAVVDSLRTLADHFRSTVTFVSPIPHPIVEGAREIGMRAAFDRLAPRITTTYPRPRAAAPPPTRPLRNLRAHANCLVVWNHTRSLRAFAEAAGPDWLYLSSRMCPRDRREVLREVHHRKSHGQPLRLAADAIGEAIDATFEVVWREMTDLPSLAIASQRADAGDQRAGTYRVFPTAELTPEAHVTRLLLLDGSLRLTASSTWAAYDRDLRLSRGRATWAEDLQRDREQLRFRTIASKILRVGGGHPASATVALGETGLVPVIVRAPARAGDEPVTTLIKRLAASGPDPQMLRQLADCAVWVALEERDRYLRQDRARWVADTVVYLRDARSYDSLGLRAD